MTEIRLAFPQRSPNPFMVPWTWTAPASTAASEFATARSQSLCVWIPTAAESSLTTFRVMDATSSGMEPPLVSHRITTRAPASAAVHGLQGVLRIGLMPVEIVLRIEQHFAAGLDEQGNAFADHRQILVQ